MINIDRSIIQKVRFSFGEAGLFSFDIKRDDLIDPVISGNKWRKLKYNVEKAKQNKNEGILTFGGAFSNHLIASAQAAYQHGLSSIGIVRGDELNPRSNETLRACSKLGMELVFLSRSDYQLRTDKSFLAELHDTYPNYWFVPEGGANYYGAIGCQEILTDIPEKYDHIYVAMGTGTTAAGILSAVQLPTIVHGVSALKGDFLLGDVRSLLWELAIDEESVEAMLEHFVLNTTSHFGGYAKTAPRLFRLIRAFFDQTGVPLEPIYTGKTLFALMDDVAQGIIQPTDKVLMIHTGGLQGGQLYKEELPFLAY